MPGFLARPHIARDAEDFCNRRLARTKTKYMQNFFQLGIDCCVTVATEDDQTVYFLFELGKPIGLKSTSRACALVTKSLSIGFLSSEKGCVGQVLVGYSKLIWHIRSRSPMPSNKGTSP